MSTSTPPVNVESAEKANWQGYFIRAVGSFPANIGIAIFQTMVEMMIDTARMGAEIVKAPYRAQHGKLELAFRTTVDAAYESMWNLVRNVFRPFRRSHLIGKEVSHMMDIGMAFKATLGQIKQRFLLFRESLKVVSEDHGTTEKPRKTEEPRIEP